MQIGSLGNFTFGIRILAQHQEQIAKTVEQLSTGKKINRASDDPTGMVAAVDHKVRIYSIEKQLDGLKQSESYFGAKEGGLSVISDRMIELNSLVVQAANVAGNSQEELDGIAIEINSVLESINHIATTTTYKGDTILSEYNTGSIAEGLNSLASMAIDDPEAAQKLAQESVDKVATIRAVIGTKLKSIDSKTATLNNELVNLTDSLSLIEDVDYAEATAKLIRTKILEDASLLAIDINRNNAQQVLGLIKDATQTIAPTS